MASRFILPFADVGNGISPSAGAQLFFFDAGTSTPRDTFSDEAATTPNSNPVTSDGTGVFSDIWIVGTYKVVLKDKNDVQIWEADPVKEEDVTAFAAYALVADARGDDDLQNNIGGFVRIAEYTAGTPIDNMYQVVPAGTATEDKGLFHDSVTSNLFQLKLVTDKSRLTSIEFGVGTTDVPESPLQLQRLLDAVPAGGEAVLLGKINVTGPVYIQRPMTISMPNQGWHLYSDEVGHRVRQSTIGADLFVIDILNTEVIFFPPAVSLGDVNFERVQLTGPQAGIVDEAQRAGKGISVRIDGGASASHVRSHSFRDVVIKAFEEGIDLTTAATTDAYLNRFWNPKISQCDTGIVLPGNQNNIFGANIVACGTCLDASNASRTYLFGGTFSESMFGVKMKFSSGIWAYGVQFETFAGDADSSAIFISGGNNFGSLAKIINGCSFLDTGTGAVGILIDNDGGFADTSLYGDIDGNDFNVDIAVKVQGTPEPDLKGLVFGAANTNSAVAGTTDPILGSVFAFVADTQFVNFNTDNDMRRASQNSVGLPWRRSYIRHREYQLPSAVFTQQRLDVITLLDDETFTLYHDERYSYDATTEVVGNANILLFVGGVQQYSNFGSGYTQNEDSAALFTRTNTSGGTEKIVVRASNDSGSTLNECVVRVGYTII